MIKSSEIKQVALTNLKGKWPKAFSITALFTLVNIALSYVLTVVQNLTTNTPILHYGVTLIYLAIFLPLSFGLISSIRKLLKEEKVDCTTFLNDAILNSTKVISIFIKTLLKILLPSILIIVGILGILLLTTFILPFTEPTLSGYALYIYLLSAFVFVGIAISVLPYSLSSYVLTDNKDLTAKEIIMKSADLMKNNKWNLVKLLLSFLGWLILISISSTIIGMLTFEAMVNYVQWFGMIFLMPYLLASLSTFYEETLNNQ